MYFNKKINFLYTFFIRPPWGYRWAKISMPSTSKTTRDKSWSSKVMMRDETMGVILAFQLGWKDLQGCFGGGVVVF